MKRRFDSPKITFYVSGTLQNLQFDMQDFASLADIAKLPRTLASVLPSLRDISLPQILGPHENM